MRPVRLFIPTLLLTTGLAVPAWAGCLDQIAVPSFPAAGAPPEVTVLDEPSAIASFVVPGCLDFAAGADTTNLVVLAGHIGEMTMERLIDRIAAFSTIEDILYWSTTRKEWRPLASKVQTLRSADPDTPRPDPTPAEFVDGAIFYVLQDDEDPMSALVTRVDVNHRGGDGLLMHFENVNAGTVLGMTVLPTGDLKTVLAAEPDGRNGIRLLSLTSMQFTFPDWLMPGKASHINRAVALYRHLAGIRTDKEPPAAP
ncbi:MAG: hypothetical protein H6851_08230 [Geminicoccaceae bacterium]|nr:hypothetical protein [Geminicoccaceae bacterium]